MYNGIVKNPLSLVAAVYSRVFSQKRLNILAKGMNTPPAKAGGFGLRLKAGLVGHSAD